MPFSPGDQVLVRSLNRRGTIVDAHGDRYRVAVGALTVTVGDADLQAAASGKDGRRRGRAAAPEKPAHEDPGPTHRVDLHGLTQEAAREAVIAAVNAAVLAGAAVLEVMHGVGTGRVREAAIQELRRLPVVRHVRPHPSNRGITLAHL